MKTLITGAGGFIGSHLAELCVQSGYEVAAFMRYNSRNNWGWLENSKYKSEIEFISGDVRDYESVARAIRGREIVFHLAALIGIPYSLVSPLAYHKTNIEGAYNVLEAGKNEGVRSIIVTSTSETYGTAQQIPINEGHPNVGQSPYAASKIGADQLAISYYRSFNVPVKIVRPFNVYGPRQSARAIIPTIITQILRGRKELKLGNLMPTRDLTYVSDTAKAFIEVQKTDGIDGEVVNVGMNMETSVAELVDLISSMTNVKVSVFSEHDRIRPRNYEVEKLVCDNRKLLSKTSWRPDYDLTQGIKATIEWYAAHLDDFKPEIYNV